jgi:hypothetical protein
MRHAISARRDSGDLGLQPLWGALNGMFGALGLGRGRYPAILQVGMVITVAFAQVRPDSWTWPLAGFMICCAASHSRSCMARRWQYRTCHLGSQDEGEQAAYTAGSGRSCNQGGSTAPGSARGGLWPWGCLSQRSGKQPRIR